MKDDSNPYAAPKAQEAPPEPTLRSKVPASAGNLELRIKTPIPAVCLKCATAAKIQRREEIFSWSVRKRRSFWLWASLFGLMGGLGAKLLHKDNDRTAKLSLPLCGSCNTSWSVAKALASWAWLAIFCVLLFSRRFVDALDALVLLCAAIGAAALMAHELKKRSLQPLYIDEDIVVLTGSTPVVVEKLAAARVAEKKKRKARPPLMLREADAIEDRIGYEAGSENTLSLDRVASDERDADR